MIVIEDGVRQKRRFRLMSRLLSTSLVPVAWCWRKARRQILTHALFRRCHSNGQGGREMESLSFLLLLFAHGAQEPNAHAICMGDWRPVFGVHSGREIVSIFLYFWMPMINFLKTYRMDYCTERILEKTTFKCHNSSSLLFKVLEIFLHIIHSRALTFFNASKTE